MSDDLTTADVSSALSRVWWLPVAARGGAPGPGPAHARAAAVVGHGPRLDLRHLRHPRRHRRRRRVVREPQGARRGVVPAVRRSSASRSASWSWSGPPRPRQILFYLIAGLGAASSASSGSSRRSCCYRARDAGWYWVLTFGLVNFLFGLLLLTHPQTSSRWSSCCWACSRSSAASSWSSAGSRRRRRGQGAGHQLGDRLRLSSRLSSSPAPRSTRRGSARSRRTRTCP